VAENWSLKGEYLASCTCRVSPCPCTTAGGDPTEDGVCKGFNVFSIREGAYGGTDLSGVNFGLIVHWVGNVLNGNWDLGVLVDDSASEDQAQAVETIVKGDAGGTFSDIAGLVGNYMGADRVAITFETSDNGDTGRATADGSTINYTSLKAPSGKRTELHHGALAFRDLIYPGKSEGPIDHFGIQGDSNYGEWSNFEFAGP
jgi:hypothetical protein